MKPRRVILTIEVETALPLSRLRETRAVNGPDWRRLKSALEAAR